MHNKVSSNKYKFLSLRSVLEMPELLGESGDLIVRLTTIDSD
jgi:hypothetical protein